MGERGLVRAVKARMWVVVCASVLGLLAGAAMGLVNGDPARLATTLSGLSAQVMGTGTSGGVAVLAVVDPVTMGYFLALGVIGGFAVGLLLAAVLGASDRRIGDTRAYEDLFDVPVLVGIPQDKFKKNIDRRLLMVEEPQSVSADAYRVLRNSVDLFHSRDGVRAIAITSAAPDEGKSSVAVNLATALAQAGRRVVYVSVDFRRPSVSRFFAASDEVGLSDVLLGAKSLRDALQRPGDEQLLVLASGRMPSNPSELLASQKMGDVVDALGQWGEWVIIDAPALLAVSDASSVVRWADGVLFVSRAGTSTRDDAEKAVRVMQNVGANLLGVVVWGLRPRSREARDFERRAGGGYYYTTYYGRGAGKQPNAKAKASGPVAVVEPDPVLAPPEVKGGGSGVWRSVRNVLVGVLSFLVVLVIAGVVVYYVAGYMGWDLGPVIAMVPRF